MNSIASLIPHDWANTLHGGMCGIGLDVASTTNKTSNPSSLTVTEYYAGLYWQRLVLRWKTGRKDIMKSALETVIGVIPQDRRKALIIDKSNEKFLANQLEDELAHLIRVVGITGNQKVTYQGEESDAKTALGSFYLSLYEDGLIAMADEKWLKDDHRLVTRNGSKFDAVVDSNGGHADTFDSGKLSVWCFVQNFDDIYPPTPGLPPSNNAAVSLDDYDAVTSPNNAAVAARPF